MKWTKFSDEQPDCSVDNKYFLITDCIKVYIAWTDHETWYTNIPKWSVYEDIPENIQEFEARMMHWCRLSDIELPKENNETIY